MKKSHLLVLFFIICSLMPSFTGCAGKHDINKDSTKIEDDYKSDRDVTRQQDRDRLDHGGY